MSLNDLASALGKNGNKKFLVDMILRLLTPLSSQWDTLSPLATGGKFIPAEKKPWLKRKDLSDAEAGRHSNVFYTSSVQILKMSLL